MRRRWTQYAVIVLGLLIGGEAAADESPVATPSRVEEGRFRGGGNFLAGAGLSAGMKGTVYGGALRGGWQLNRRFAFYAQGEIFKWDGVIKAGDMRAEGGVGARLIALGSYSPFEWLELGIGPSLDGAANLVITSTMMGSTTAPVTYGGAYFGFHEHVGFRIPFTREQQRLTGLSIVSDAHSMVGEDRVATTVTGGLGYEWF